MADRGGVSFGRSSTTPQQASQSEPFAALLHQPLFGTSLPATEPSEPQVERMVPPPPAGAPYPEHDTSAPEHVPDGMAAVVEPTLRLVGADPAARPGQNSLLRERVPIVLPPRAKRRRRPFRFLLKLVLVLAFFAAVAAAVWYVVLPRLHRAQWQGDVKPIAEEVATARGLTWDHPVEVVRLGQLEYGTMLARSTLGVTEENESAVAGEWRAMGLAEGALDFSAVGAEASADRPAFFDARDDVVYALASLEDPLRVLALRRALAEALIAQQAGPPVGEPGSSASLAARLLTEADAATTAEAMPVEQADRTAAVLQRSSLVTATPGASRYPIDLMLGDAGVTTIFAGVSDPAVRASISALRPLSDAALLDVGRPISSLPATVSAAPAQQKGMVYWYYALASRLPAAQAWSAAAAWNGDDVVINGADPSGGRVCVTASIVAVDASGRNALFAALTEWSAAAPPSAASTVALDGDRIALSSCDPGADADTITSTATPFGDAPIEIALLGDLDAAPDLVRRCIIDAVRGFGVAATVRIGDQPAADAAMADIRNACGA